MPPASRTWCDRLDAWVVLPGRLILVAYGACAGVFFGGCCGLMGGFRAHGDGPEVYESPAAQEDAVAWGIGLAAASALVLAAFFWWLSGRRPRTSRSRASPAGGESFNGRREPAEPPLHSPAATQRDRDRIAG